MNEKKHPCLSCGACCAQFRVSFHWLESLPDSFAVPIEYTYKLNEHRLAMRGVGQDLYRCAALLGNLGEHVGCSIYKNRPSPCREFLASYEAGVQEPRCDSAREKIGLQVLQERDWI